MRWLIGLGLAAAMTAATTLAVEAQPRAGTPPFQVAGTWICQKNAQSAPGGTGVAYTIEAQVQLNPDSSALVQGAVYNPQLLRSVQPFQGQGTWTYWAVSDWGHPMMQIRVQTTLGSWINWWVRPLDQNRMFNAYTPEQVQASGFYVEDGCQRAG